MLDWRVLLFGPRTAMLRRCERGLQNDEFTTRALSRRGRLLGAAAHLREAAGMAACSAGGPTSLQTADAKSIQQRAHNAKEEREVHVEGDLDRAESTACRWRVRRGRILANDRLQDTQTAVPLPDAGAQPAAISCSLDGGR